MTLFYHKLGFAQNKTLLFFDCACDKMVAMSKIAKYLNGHILGEVSARESRLRNFSTDRSILKIQPNLVVFPRIADDIRKIMRFSWQLAEKGHNIPVTARGFGGSTDGSSITNGIVLDISRHMDNVKELDIRTRSVKVQAGANFSKLNLAIASQAMSILSSPAGERLTVGGAIAMNLPSEKFNHGTLLDVTRSLEVILSDGSVIKTGRISKKELGEKLAQQDFEGEVYRKLDALIEESQSAISKIDADASYGYNGLTKVKLPDGSFDLTPLFFGSLGTLGVITEADFRAEYIVDETKFMVVAFSNRDDARDFIDLSKKFQPNIIELFDGKMFEAAVASGKKYDFYLDRVSKKLATKLVLVVGISDKTSKKIKQTFKKIEGLAERFDGATTWAPDDSEAEKAELETIRDVREILRSRAGVIKEEIYPIQGVYVPLERFEQFYLGLQKLALKHSIPAPVQGSALTNVFEILAEFDFSKVSDRRKALQFITDLNALLATVDGEFGFGAGEGRIYGSFVARYLDDDVLKVFDEVREIFDPNNILNKGVKGLVNAKELVKNVRSGK